MQYTTLFITSFAFIALRAFQQLNVGHDRYMWVPPVSFGMAVCEVLIITKIVASGSLYAALPLACGGFLGSWFSMWLHKKMRNSKT